MTTKKHIYFLKYFMMVMLLFVLYILQTTPGLFSIYGVKPILVVPAAVCIAMFEGELVGGVMGAVAGLLCDLASFTIFGFNGILVLAGCIAVGLLTIHLTQLKLTNALMLGFGALFLRGLIEYFFYFQMWGFEDGYRIFVFSTLPTVLYSTVAIIPFYYMTRGMKEFFDQKLKV
ncbi:rod shape-determining protein MreD [Hydrogenoanaerobacterium sp.]|uniref:rod shape-determining protein MreD n=1 Tax=Hydrogenoanaerobacterium sp. TaxID=2953763 RepID=UPI0028976DA6|nr:rod shape-determining protein MreD [Hydrogenoanaerobacterium sp.]